MLIFGCEKFYSKYFIDIQHFYKSDSAEGEMGKKHEMQSQVEFSSGCKGSVKYSSNDLVQMIPESIRAFSSPFKHLNNIGIDPYAK